MSIIKRSRISFALACALGFGLVGNCALANGATFDTSLGDRPCDVVTAQMVATTFDVPEKSLQQSEPLKSWCAYELEESGKTLEVLIYVATFDGAAAAKKDLRDSSRSMSAEEISEQLQAMGIAFDESDNDSNLPMPQPTSVTFEDIDGIANQARFNTNEGWLHLQQNNLRINLSAFYGPNMRMPDQISFKAMVEADSAWKEETISKRKEQAIKLAKIALAEL